MADPHAAPGTPIPAPAAGRLMLASGLAMVIFAATLAIPSVCLETLGREFGLTLQQRGLLFTSRLALLLVALPLTGHFADRRGKRLFLLLGLLVIGLSQLLIARAPGYGALLAGMAFLGLGKGAMDALVNPLAAQLNPQRSARTLNFLNGLFSVGLVVVALSAGEMLQRGSSWRLLFAVWVLPVALCASLYWTRGYPPTPRPAGGAREQVRRFLTDPLFWVLAVAMVLGGGCEAGLTSWGPNYVARELGASARGGAWTIALYGAFMAAGRFTTGGLMGRLTPLRLMLISAAGCAVACAGLSVTHSLPGAWALFALGGLFVACFWPTLLAVASDHIAVGSTTLFALLSTAGATGAVIVPWGIGALGDGLGLRPALLLLPGSMILMIALLLAARGLIRERSR